MQSIDRAFAFYIAIYIGFFFLAIIFFVSRTLNVFKEETIGKGQLFSVSGLAFLAMLFLFYALKEFALIHELSSATKSTLYEYVLNTKPEERTTKFFEEVRCFLPLIVRDNDKCL